MLLELLALGGGGAEQRPAANDQVATLPICVLLDEEILLLVTHIRHHALRMLAEALGGGGAEQRPAANDQVATLPICVLLDEEILLLVTHIRHHALRMLAEEGEHALGLLVQRRHRAQQRGLLVERLARVGAKRGGDAQDVVLDERRARGVPGGYASFLMRKYSCSSPT